MSEIKYHCKHDELIEATQLIENPQNPNQHSSAQIELLAKIITQQGWRNPVIVSNESGFIVAGHGRVRAALIMKDQRVPVSYQSFESPALEHAHLLSDNRLSELSEMNNTALKDLLIELDTGEFDMDLTGYDGKILENLMTQFYVENEDDEWNGMPEFSQQDKTAFKSIVVHFKDQDCYDQFKETVGQNLTPQTRMIWFPEIEIERALDKVYK